MNLADELETLAAKATKGDLTTAERHVECETVECPFCNGDGEVEATDYCNFDDKALGVQFYGIGTEFGAHEKLWRKLVENLPIIITALRAAELCPDEGCPHYGTLHSHPPEPEQVCSTCGASKPEDNVVCSNSFHAPPAEPAQVGDADLVERVAEILWKPTADYGETWAKTHSRTKLTYRHRAREVVTIVRAQGRAEAKREIVSGK